MKRLFWIGLLVLVLSLALASAAHADNGQTGGNGGNNAAATALVLAPLVAAATAIERIIEMIFNWYESMLLSVSGFLNLGGSYVKWARQQVQKYREALIKATDEGEISRLEELLLDAQQRLEDSLKSEPYVSLKRAIAVLLGIALGVVSAFTVRLQMFKLLGIDLASQSAAQANPALASFLMTMDIIITGVVIGTGSAPVHSLIGILQNTGDAIDQLRALAQGRSIAAIHDMLPTGAEPGAFGKRGAVTGVAVPEGPSRVEVQRTARRLLD